MKLKKNLVLFGAGGHARSILNAVDSGDFEAISTVTWGAEIFESHMNPTNLHFPELSSLNFSEDSEYMVAIGDQAKRAQLISELESYFPAMRFATILSKNSDVSKESKIGIGVFIGSGAYVGPGSEIGDHVVLNTASIVEHDCEIAELVFVSPSVSIGGGSVVGKNSFLGIGAIIRDGVSIKSDCVIGAGSLVLKDIETSGMYYGVPAKLVD